MTLSDPVWTGRRVAAVARTMPAVTNGIQAMRLMRFMEYLLLFWLGVRKAGTRHAVANGSCRAGIRITPLVRGSNDFVSLLTKGSARRTSQPSWGRRTAG